MALTIEDGTGVEGADSFATVAEAQAFATARGLTLPETDAEIEPLLVKAADFLLGMEDRFQGTRSKQDQRLPFPRYAVVLPGGWELGSSAIPAAIKEAQIRLAIDANSTDLRPNGTGQEVVREKVGPLETEYNPTGAGTVSPSFHAAMDLLSPLLRAGGVTVSRA